MPTDAQGRTLSDDGNYYWDGSAWQPVQAGDTAQGGAASGSQGPTLENYSGDGSDLTQEQKEYLNAYALHQTEAGNPQTESASGSLSENAEGEWA